MEFLLIFWTNRLSAQFPTITRSEVYLRQESLKLRQSSNWAANLFKIWQNSNAAFVVFYHIPEVYSVDNYSIWCIRKIFYLHLSIPRAQANTVQHTYLIVVSIISVYQTIICLLYVKSLRNLKKLFNWQSKQILI